MRNIIQKLRNVGIVASLLSVICVSATAVAAAKPYTCILADNQGQAVQQVKPCGSFLPTGKDSTGKQLSKKSCYELNEVRGNITATELSCSNNRLSGAKQVICPNDSPAPDNQIAKCKADTGVTNYCTDGSEAPQNDLSQCSNNGDCSKGLQNCTIIAKYLKPFIKFLSALVGLAVVFSIIVGGIQYASSADDPSKVTAAKNRIRNAIVALVTFIFLFALLNFLIPGGLT